MHLCLLIFHRLCERLELIPHGDPTAHSRAALHACLLGLSVDEFVARGDSLGDEEAAAEQDAFAAAESEAM